MGALKKSTETYHCSILEKERSIVFNQSIRDKFFDPKKEFVSQKINKLSLIKNRKSLHVYWIWENAQIKRSMFNPFIKQTSNIISNNA